MRARSEDELSRLKEEIQVDNERLDRERQEDDTQFLQTRDDRLELEQM